MKKMSALTLAALGTTTMTSVAQTAAPTTDLPVKEIALFSSGVGYFQHEGPVKDNARAELQFKTAQVNDILKSLVLRDLGGGTIGAVTYPSQDPIEKTLRSFQVDITGNPPLGDLLNQLRGAKVSLTAATERMVGTILGVETREIPSGGDKGAPIKAQFLNVITGGALRSVAVSDLRGLQFDDTALQAELEKALTALAAARDKDKKTVVLQFNGKGERPVRLGYVVETPVWKTSYRLVFGNSPEAKPQMQGWALVENQTENDWNDVKLSLVSGRPISFVQDLYSPLYVARQVVQNETYAAVRSQRYEEGLRPAPPAVAAAPMPAPAAKRAAGLAGREASRGAGIGSFAAESSPSDASAAGGDGVSVTAESGQVGELFQYTVSGVSLARQRSAMIPIVNDAIQAEKVSIFNESVQAKFPLYGARLKNSVNLHLLGGPVTVFDEGRYAGDARISDFPPGQTRLVSYGVDLQLPVLVEERKTDQKQRVGKISGGVLEVSQRTVSSLVYTIENKSSRPKKLVIEYPNPGSDWKLVETAAPQEKTASLYRFEVTVAPGKVEKLPVRAERVDLMRYALVSQPYQTLVALLQNGEPSQGVREAVVKAGGLQQAIAETENQIRTRETQLQKITDEQERLRENVKTTGDKSEYGVRLLRKLNDQENQIEKLQGEISGLQKKLETQRRELADYVKNLNLG